MSDMVTRNDFECLACGSMSSQGVGVDGNLCPECSQSYLDVIKPELLMYWGRFIRRVLCTIIEESPRLLVHHRPMMRMLHGFAPYHEQYTLEEVAEEFDFPIERIKQINGRYVMGELMHRIVRLDQSDDDSEEIARPSDPGDDWDDSEELS